MKKFFSVFICLLLSLCLVSCSVQSKEEKPKEEIGIATFENGVTKIRDNLYTVTITDEYDVHCMDELLRGYYWNDDYAGYYDTVYGEVVSAALEAAGAACSGARNGNFAGRTYDWYYSDFPSVIVKTTATENRLASISCFSGARNTEQIENDAVDVFYSLIANDGINEAGVVFQTNVLQLGDEVTTGTNPDGPDTITLIIGRIVLDNAHSADEAVEIIKGLNVYATYSDRMVDESHFMISDKDKSVVVEFVDNKVVVTESNVITNFYVNNQYFDGTLDSIKANQPGAMGWRRYYLLKDGIDDVGSVEEMFNHMSKVFYWHAYDADSEDYWYDEGYGLYDFDGNGKFEYFDILNESDDNPVCKAYKDYYCGIGHMTEFDNGTWFTAHTSIFDIEKKEMTIVVDEQGFDTAATFGFDF